MSFFWVSHFDLFFNKKKRKTKSLIPMKISPNLNGRMDGSKFWCFPWFPKNSLLCVILRYTVYKGEITIKTFSGSNFLSWQKGHGCLNSKGIKGFETMFWSAECSKRVPQLPNYCRICKPRGTIALGVRQVRQRSYLAFEGCASRSAPPSWESYPTWAGAAPVALLKPVQRVFHPIVIKLAPCWKARVGTH